jgi:hypothetical protein
LIEADDLIAKGLASIDVIHIAAPGFDFRTRRGCRVVVGGRRVRPHVIAYLLYGREAHTRGDEPDNERRARNA